MQSIISATGSVRRPYSVPVWLIIFLSWSMAILWMVGGALRDNDQASYISGALQLLSGEQSIWHARLYNYDKQFGSYWLLTAVIAAAGTVHAILATNAAQAAMLCVTGGIMCAVTRFRTRPLALTLPFVLSPVVVLSGPFVGTSMLSLIFLLLAFAAAQRAKLRSIGAGCVLVAIAACCRGDAILAVPALILHTNARQALARLAIKPVVYLTVLAALMPPLVGRLLEAQHGSDFAGLVLRPAVVVAFLVFGLGLGVTLLLPINVVAYSLVARRKPKWAAYYYLHALAPLPPFLFYVAQLYTPRYLFPTLASLLFAVCDRRTAVILRWMTRGSGKIVSAALIVAVVLPWFIGLRMPTLALARPTLGLADTFPSAKGHFPMGGYLAYIIQTRRAGFVLDHNEKIFLAAEQADFRPCQGVVPLLTTPMVSFLALALRQRGVATREVGDTDPLACGYAYADIRSLIRAADANRVDPGRVADAVALVGWYAGQAIAELGTGPTPFGAYLAELKRRSGGHEFEYWPVDAAAPIDLSALAKYGGAIATRATGACSLLPASLGTPQTARVGGQSLSYWPIPRSAAAQSATLRCASPVEAALAVTVLPPYMGL
jgi:hypothetical protein